MNSLSLSGPRPTLVMAAALRSVEMRAADARAPAAAAPAGAAPAAPGATASTSPVDARAAAPTAGALTGERRTISADEARSSRARAISGERQALARLFGASSLVGRVGVDDVLDALGRRPHPRPRPTASTTTMADRPPPLPLPSSPAPTAGGVQRTGCAGVDVTRAACPGPGAPTAPAAAEAARPRATSAGGPVDDGVPVGGPLISLGTPVPGPDQGIAPKRPSRPTGSTSHLKR
jgi:hypothetical protein